MVEVVGLSCDGRYCILKGKIFATLILLCPSIHPCIHASHPRIPPSFPSLPEELISLATYHLSHTLTPPLPKLQRLPLPIPSQRVKTHTSDFLQWVYRLTVPVGARKLLTRPCGGSRCDILFLQLARVGGRINHNKPPPPHQGADRLSPSLM